MNMANIMNDFLFEKIFFSEPCCLLFSTLIIKGTGFNPFTSKSSLLDTVNITLALGRFFLFSQIGDKGILTFLLKEEKKKVKAALGNLV